MSQENVEIVRRGIEVWNRGDMDAFRELHDPDAVLRPVSDWPEQGPFVGRTTLMRFAEQLRDTWDADTMEAISITEVGDRVVFRFVWHGAGHGPEANLEMTDVLTLRKGRICEHELFWDQAEALEAAGLRE
jgi:ketosteroid isomerase-like protein